MALRPCGGVAVRGNNMYLFGGAVEIGDTEAGFSFNFTLSRLSQNPIKFSYFILEVKPKLS